MLRASVKRVAEQALRVSGAAVLHRRLMADRVLILAYHNVVPDGVRPAGDLPNHLPLRSFTRQLDALAATHDVVTLREALTPRGVRSNRPRVAISFDDAYRGALRHAVPELVRRSMPVTIFVAPGQLEDVTFWWDGLAGQRGGLDPAVRDTALDTLGGRQQEVLDWARRSHRALAELDPVFRSATAAEVAGAAALPGVTLGSHTWSHPNLARLGDDELKAELERPLEWLRSSFAAHLPWIAYPYGSFDSRVVRAARDAGYEAGLAVSGGWVPPRGADGFALPRVNIPHALSPSGFTLRAAGLFCT